MDIFPEIRIKRRKYPESVVYRPTEKPGHQCPDFFHGVIRSVQFECDAAGFVTHAVQQFHDLGCIKRFPHGYVSQKII